MNRRTALMGMVATVAGATAVPTAHIAGAVHHKTSADLFPSWQVAKARADKAEQKRTEAEPDYLAVKPEAPVEIWISKRELYSNLDAIDCDPDHIGSVRNTRTDYLRSSGWQLFYERLPHNPDYQKRANVARQWEAECKRVKVATGYAAVEQKASKTERALAKIEAAILDTPATGLSDIHAKLTVITSKPNYAISGDWQERLEALVVQLANTPAV